MDGLFHGKAEIVIVFLRHFSDNEEIENGGGEPLVGEPGDNDDGKRARKTVMHTGNQPHLPSSKENAL